MTLTGRFQCDDGGIYSIREMPDGQVVWFGEDDRLGAWYDPRYSSRIFANVFWGHRSGNIVAGQFYDVPKGRARGTGGPLRLKVINENQLEKATAASFSGQHWNRVDDSFRVAASGFSPPEFQGESLSDLTGVWVCNDGGTYYVHQPSLDELVWFGEHPSGRFANIFKGTLSRRPSGAVQIQGQWLDVPKVPGGSLRAGNLTVETLVPLGITLLDGNKLNLIRQTGGFGGSVWQRVDALNVVIHLNTLTVLNPEERRDEPYLWVFYVKADGDSIDLWNIGGSDVVVTAKGGSGPDNVTPISNVPTGEKLTIPDDMGYFRTYLKTIHGSSPIDVVKRMSTLLGIIVVALEEDLSANSVVAAAHRAARESLQARLTNELRFILRRTLDQVFDDYGRWQSAGGNGTFTFDPTRILQLLLERLEDVKRDVMRDVFTAAISAGLLSIDYGSLIDRDDFIGVHVLLLPFENLRTQRERDVSLDIEKYSDGHPIVHYQIEGRITAA